MHRLFALAAVTASFACSASDLDARNAIEATIRKLDLAEADAVLRGDIAAVEKLWAKDMTVNNPFNQVVKANSGRVRTGVVTYASFVRDVESVQVHGETVIAMGSETVVPSGKSVGAGTTIRRRYTNVWMKRDGTWLLTARHANVICPN